MRRFNNRTLVFANATCRPLPRRVKAAGWPIIDDFRPPPPINQSAGQYAGCRLFLLLMPGIHITDIEAAINYWREKKPSPDGITLAPELRALAEVYALLVFYHEDEADERSFPPQGPASMAGLVRHHRRHALHCDLLDQPGRCRVQGLRAPVRGSAALARNVARRQTCHLAPHHAGRHVLAVWALFGPGPGKVLIGGFFKPFWPLAQVELAQAAINLVATRFVSS